MVHFGSGMINRLGVHLEIAHFAMWVCLRIGYTPKSRYLHRENDDNPMDVEVTLFSDNAMWFQHGEYSWKCSWPVSCVWPTIEMAESMHRCHRADLPLNLFRSCMWSTHGPMLWRANAPDFCLSTWWFTPVGKWVIPPVIAGNPAKNWGYTSYTSHLLTRLNH